jgi:probable phosphoglycerate mutase
MPILLLIRHGENDYVKTGKMAGRLPGVHLNDKGKQQAQDLADSLKDAPITAIYSSPLERAIETAAPLAKARKLKIKIEPRVMDTDIGAWQGLEWKKLAKLPVWKIVQHTPSRFRFPKGESFLECQTRLVNGIESIAAAHDDKAIIAVVMHADPIKLIVAHYTGMPLDNFQRLSCDTGSMTIMALGKSGAQLIKLNQRPPFMMR